jgi:hypothetical protein
MSKNDENGAQYYSIFYSAIGQLTFRYTRQGDSTETSINFAIGLETETTYTVLMAVDTSAEQLTCAVYNSLGTRVLESTAALSSGLVADCIVGDADCYMTVGARSMGSSTTNAWTGTISRAILYPAQVVLPTEVETLLADANAATTPASPSMTFNLLSSDNLSGVVRRWRHCVQSCLLQSVTFSHTTRPPGSFQTPYPSL